LLCTYIVFNCNRAQWETQFELGNNKLKIDGQHTIIPQ